MGFAHIASDLGNTYWDHFLHAVPAFPTNAGLLVVEIYTANGSTRADPPVSAPPVLLLDGNDTGATFTLFEELDVGSSAPRLERWWCKDFPSDLTGGTVEILTPNPRGSDITCGYHLFSTAAGKRGSLRGNYQTQNSSTDPAASEFVTVWAGLLGIVSLAASSGVPAGLAAIDADSTEWKEGEGGGGNVCSTIKLPVPATWYWGFTWLQTTLHSVSAAAFEEADFDTIDGLVSLDEFSTSAEAEVVRNEADVTLEDFSTSCVATQALNDVSVQMAAFRTRATAKTAQDFTGTEYVEMDFEVTEELEMDFET